MALKIFCDCFSSVITPTNWPAFLGKGCLLVNTVVELPDSEPALVGRAIGYLKLAEQSLAIYFKNAQKNGSLGLKHNPKALAKFYMNTKKGLMVSLRHGTALTELTDVIETALLLIKSE